MTRLNQKGKRAVKDIPIFLDARLWSELESLVSSCQWPYKTNVEEFHQRDKALICLLILSGLRVSELLKLKRLQFRIYENKTELANVKTLKNGLPRDRIILPHEGKLAPFTRTFEEWLLKVPSPECYVFPRGSAEGFHWDRPLGRKRVFWIIKTSTNRFPHWFRSVCETVYGRIIFRNNAWKLKEFMGLKRLDSTTPYVRGSWEEDENRIYQL